MKNKQRVKFVLDPKNMAMVCPAWLDIRHKARSGNVQIKNVCLDDPEAEFAIKLLLDISHGNKETRENLKTATARELFYVGEIFNWLGRPRFLRTPAMDLYRSRCLRRSNVSFIPPETIARGIQNLILQAKGLRMVEDWLLLGVVADRFGLSNVRKDVENAVVMSCRSDGSSIVDRARRFCTPGQWDSLQSLGFMDERMWLDRRVRIDRIFDTLRLLIEQVINFEAGILPNESLFNTWSDNNIAPCGECTPLPMNTLIRALMAERLWPLSAKSYQGSVNDLLEALEAVGRTMGIHEFGNSCNPYSHFLGNLVFYSTEEVRA
ncbi:hypothetical protein EDB80DRAFT_872229 [Ilyonectria destructans]|nr:hypothetical protein EDB80DRAFT_872229 [Ilyonectria destructans]